MSKTAKEIVIEYLKQNGYDGLGGDQFGDGCGCTLDNLAPCGGNCMACEPAYIKKCDTKNCDTFLDGECEYANHGGDCKNDEFDQILTTEKQKEKNEF